MTELLNGERQVAPTVEGIRADHVARYRWAAGLIPEGAWVCDVACGVGYGTRMLADACGPCDGFDISGEAIAYARQHYQSDRTSFAEADLRSLTLHHRYDVAVCFETVEHLEDPRPMLRELRRQCGRLLVSVPNEAAFPYGRGYKFHFRHYTKADLSALLAETGWRPVSWWGQADATSEVTMGLNDGRTLVAAAEPAKHVPHPRQAEIDAIKRKARAEVAAILRPPPRSVALLGLGPSIGLYLDTVKRLGGRKKIADETWAINALGDIIKCERVFHMDDIRIQMARAQADPESNIAAMVEWLRHHPGPIYTSTPHPDFPGMVEFPLEEVINNVPFTYFNNTCSYAVAFAIHLGVRKLSMWGIDFTYPDAHSAEKGRGCVEFWLGYAASRGVQLEIAGTSTLMDANVPPEQRWYGYDYDDIGLKQDGPICRVVRQPRKTVPTANEIEERYDHGQHPAGELAGQVGVAA